MNLGDLLREVPDGPLVHTSRETATRDEIQASADRIGAALQAAGVEPGEAVGVQLPNTPLLVAALFGIWQHGAVYVPLNPRSPLEETRYHLDLVRPVAVLSVEDDLRELIGGEDEDVQRGDGWVLRRAASTEGGWIPNEAVALIQFTSGTTGRPKPVPLEHANVIDLLDRVVSSLRSTKRAPDTPPRPPMPNLVPLSLSLWSGIYQVLFAFRVGAPAVLMERFETTVFVDLVTRFEIRSTVLPPAAMIMLSNDEAITDLRPLKYVRSISAPLHPAQARRFRDRFGIVVLNAYGQTEIGGEIIGWSASDARTFGDAKLGSVGRPHEGIAVRAGGLGETEEVAELQVQTPATKERRVAAEVLDRLTDDGWLSTGDIGRIDDDGFVWIEGRVSDMINRGGMKVFPAQVEEAIMTCPSVRDVAVVGADDERLGEVPWAFVVSEDGSADPAVLEAWCRERLSPYKVPERFIDVGALPRNETGKVLRAQLLALEES